MGRDAALALRPSRLIYLPAMAAAPTSPPADEAPSIKLEADRAYVDLRDRIVTLRLAPGTVLREDELMRELDIGRTPLREAVKRLALENLVIVQPRSGTFVTGVDAADIVHISEVRAELEAHAAELAASRMDGATRERAEALLEQARAREGAAGAAALMRLDEAIHRVVWEGSRNPYLAETLERYFALSLRVWYLVLDRVPALGATVFDHARLLEAILERDPARARTLMREHVIGFEREIMAAFRRD
jgi:DNA-binding GntR family transcriptional regulator